MPELPHPGQKVSWRDPRHAHNWGWDDIFGPGPFEVIRPVNRSNDALAWGLVLRTNVGEWEISEVWLSLAEEPKKGGAGDRQGEG
jgi:hypothetical protein